MSEFYFNQNEVLDSSSTSSIAQIGGLATAIILTTFAPNAAAASSGGGFVTGGLSGQASVTSVSTLTRKPEEDLPNAFASGGYCLPSNPIELVATILKHHNFKPDIVSGLSGGSVLYEFSGEVGACVEVYPSGEIVVVIRKGELRDLYEFTKADVGLIKSIFDHAGVRVGM